MPRNHLEHNDETNVSFSELNTLATCEEKWHQNYELRREGQPTQSMAFGTVMHYLTDWWWHTNEVLPAYVAAETEEVELPETGQKSLAAADWLIERYVAMYQPLKDRGWHRDPEHGGEVTRGATITVTGVGKIGVWGTADDVLIDEWGKRVMVERKTMADWRRLALVDVTPQETLYQWLCEANDIETDRVVFDAIKNYQWTRDKHPPADSFQLVDLHRGPQQIAGALQWVSAILRRRKALQLGDTPIKNLSVQTCTGCAYQDTCWESLAFPHDIEVVDADART